MKEILNKIQIRKLYLELIAEPSLVLELSEYKKSKILEYADLEINACFKFADEIIVDPKFNYPKQYKGKELEYLLTRQDNYHNAMYVKNIIKAERISAKHKNSNQGLHKHTILREEDNTTKKIYRLSTTEKVMEKLSIKKLEDIFINDKVKESFEFFKTKLKELSEEEALAIYNDETDKWYWVGSNTDLFTMKEVLFKNEYIKQGLGPKSLYSKLFADFFNIKNTKSLEREMRKNKSDVLKKNEKKFYLL